MADLSANELTVLVLLVERPSHGWSLAAKLARGGEIGNVWSISRPSVYHALDRLEDVGLIEARGLERGGRGPHRVIYAATSAGRAAAEVWLGAPVHHVRDVRSLLLLKVVLSERLGRDVEPLLVAQRAVLAPFVGWLEAKLDDADDEVPGEHAVAAFRLETTTAILRFIDARLDSTPARLGNALARSAGYSRRRGQRRQRR